MNDLRTPFLKMLQYALDTEAQLTSALSEMIPMATHGDLKAAFEEHLKQTENHRSRLEDLISKQEMSSDTLKNEGLAAMIVESRSMLTEVTDNDVRDALLIATAQRAEHLEIALYGTLIAWARELGEDEAKDTFKSILNEEESADKKLTYIAEGGLFTLGINKEASV